MANRLKNMKLTSVDMVRNGANQEADICLFKSADEDPVQPTTEEKNIFKRFINWLRENPEEEQEESTAPIEKADEQPDDLVEVYKSAITESLQSIITDESLSTSEKNDLVAKSLDEYHEAMLDLFDLAKADDEEEDPDDWEWDDEEEPDDDVEKFNPNHDAEGRFASSGGGGYKAPSKEHNGFKIENDHPQGGYTASKDGKKLVTREEYYDAKSGKYKPTGREHLMQFTSVAGAKKMIDYLVSSGDIANHLAKSADIDEIEEV